MNYEIVEMEERTFAGVSAVTKNDSPDMQSVIGGLWQKLYSGVAQSMKNRVNGKSVGLYCDYAQDMSYTVLAGCQISSEGVAEAEKNGLTVKKIPAGRYAKFTVKGEVPKAVAESWDQIWNTQLERTFTGDYEEYQEDCAAGNGTIFIYLAIK